MASIDDEEFQVYKSLTEPENDKKKSKLPKMAGNIAPYSRTKETSPIWCSSRMAIALVGFFGFVNLYALRVNMSVAMVCMVNQTALNDIADISGDVSKNVTEKVPECVVDYSGVGNSTKSMRDGEFTWIKPIQGQILGSFFWGYIVTQVPGGWLSHLYGGKRVLGWSMFICAVATLLMPLGARLHFGFLMTLRIVAGLCQGVVWPAMHCVWSRWAPPMERGRLIGFTFAGSQIGNVITMPFAGLLCAYGFDGGWPSVFYVLGSFGVIWFVAWMFVVFDSPLQHPRVSHKEREYIENALEGQIGEKPERIPWKQIFTSAPVWGIIVTHTCANFGTYAFLTNIPTYLKEVLKFDIKANSALSALPYIGFWAMIIISGFIGDTLRKRNILSITWCRKLFNTLGEVVPALFVVILAHMDCTRPITAVVLLVIGVSFSGCQYSSGFVVNHADIAPRFSGLLFGISNTCATIPGFVAPIVIGIITKNQLRSEWQTVFYIAAVIYTFGAIFYLITGSGEVQPWAKDKDNIENEEIADINMELQ